MCLETEKKNYQKECLFIDSLFRNCLFYEIFYKNIT